MTNPEQHVIDEIDQLVNETMAAAVNQYGRQLDDYTTDRYPRCDDCTHAWHGVGCVYCDCPGLGGEPGGEQPHHLDRIESVRYTQVHAYTLADLEAIHTSWNRRAETMYRDELDPQTTHTGLQ